MDRQKIAIIGLGRVGSAFLQQLLARGTSRGVDLICVAEPGDTPGRQQAAKAGIPISSIDAIVGQGDALDVIFDLTGLPEVRRELREKIAAACNAHTVIASETIARVVLALCENDSLPVIEGRKTGY